MLTPVHTKDYRADKSGEYKPELFVELGRSNIGSEDPAVLEFRKGVCVIEYQEISDEDCSYWRKWKSGKICGV